MTGEEAAAALEDLGVPVRTRDDIYDLVVLNSITEMRGSLIVNLIRSKRVCY